MLVEIIAVRKSSSYPPSLTEAMEKMKVPTLCTSPGTCLDHVLNQRHDATCSIYRYVRRPARLDPSSAEKACLLVHYGLATIVTPITICSIVHPVRNVS